MPNGNNWLSLLGKAIPPFGAFAPLWEMGFPWQQPAEVAPPAQLAPRAYEVLAGLTPEERARLPAIPEEPVIQQILRRQREEEEAAAEAAKVTLKPPVPPRPTESPPSGFIWAFDRDLNRWVPEFAGLTPWQKAQQRGIPAPGEPPEDAFGRTATWNTRTGAWDYPPNFGQRPLDQPAPPPPISPYQQQQFGLQQQQLAQQAAQQQARQAFEQQQFGLQEQQFVTQQQQFQEQLAFQQQQALMATEEQERRYGAQLAAQPINWLQYASYTGQPAVVQPWMVPLGAQNVGEAQLQVGQPIPGFQPQMGQQEIQSYAGMPQLRTPSAQLQARWGPTAQAQYLGYRQARTGAAPEETQFRLGAGRAPTGAFGGFSRFR